MAARPTAEIEASPSDRTETKSQAGRQSPSLENVTGEYGFPYVSELPREEWPRIELESGKNKKPAFTLNNVSKVLEGVDWGRVCRILDVYDDKRDELAASFPSTEQQREEAIKFWMTTDPMASWRRLVDVLYGWGDTEEVDLHALGDSIRHYCEDLTDPNSTLTNLTQVLSSISTRDLPDYILSIPQSVRDEIYFQSLDEGVQRQQFLQYYIHCSPYSTSWNFLVGQLHRFDAITAEAAGLFQKFVQSKPEPTLTIANVSNVIEGVRRVDSIAQFLGIPYPKSIEMEQKNPNKRDHCREVATYYVNNVPGASWLVVANALLVHSGYAQLEKVKIYQKDEIGVESDVS